VPGHLVFGLGNPGPRYQATRHNAGFLLVDRLAARFGIALDRTGVPDVPGASVVWGEGRIADVPAVLAKPTTFMNASGEAVASLRRVLVPEMVVVTFDDLDLPLGTVRVRGGGGTGGHRGVASIVEAIGPAFTRVRIGIGRPPEGSETVDFVLGDFAPEERTILERALARAEDGVACLLREGLEAAMGRCNGAPPLAIDDPIR
jgi:PTH1 family peptidyl-tRNA hydrolase